MIVEPAGYLTVCSRDDGRDVVVDVMLRPTAGKSVLYPDELVVPEPLDAVRRHLPFKIASDNSQRRLLRPLEPAPVSVRM